MTSTTRLTSSGFFLLFLLLLLNHLTTQAQSAEIRVPGRCPETCRESLSKTYEECRTRHHRGCTMKFCGAETRATSCTLRSTGPDFIKLFESVVLYRPELSTPYTVNLDFRASPVKTDVYLLIDATGSMGSLIMAIQEEFSRLAAGVRATSDAAFGVGIFRDERELTNGFENLQSLTSSVREAQGALQNISARGGQDAEEANLVALYEVATAESIGWREASRRIVIYVADEPGHEPTCLSDGLKLTRGKVVRALNDAAISVIAMSYPPGALDRATKQLACGTDVADAGEGQGTELAEKTGGFYLGGVEDVFDVNLILSSIRKLTKRVTVDSNTCDKYVKTEYEPGLPAVLASNVRLQIKFTILASSCELTEAYQCEIAFRESDVVLKPLPVTLEKPQNCN